MPGTSGASDLSETSARRRVHTATGAHRRGSPDKHVRAIVGSEPGTVEIIDLVALKTVATVDVAQQAAGIEFWKVEAAARQVGR